MRLRTKYILFVGIIHLVTLVLTFIIFKEDKILFIASEVLVLLSLAFSWQLYRQLITPLKTLMQGIDAIRDRDFNVKFLTTGKYEMDELISVYNAMIDELREERTKQEQQHFFLEKLINTSPTGIIILDYDECIHQVNPQALRLLGMGEKALLGKPVQSIFHPLLQEISRLGSGESKIVHVNGIETYKLQKSHFIDRGFARYFIMLGELTAEMLAAEKKAYGKVIRMMAHEVNNTVGPVNSIMQSTLQTHENSPTISRALQVAIDRNHNLNLFMRNFAEIVRLPEPQLKPTDLHQLINATGQLMTLKAGEKEVAFEFQLEAEPIIIKADSLQMEQALINIIKNAIEAIEERGSITFITTARPQTLIIRDTGKGIPASKAEQLFSPFFSTKKDGQGIGLTLIREILINHGFEFSLRTISAGNTEFVIRFEE
ncbi:ATP-binding protein [Paraflavitalea sp. CAU 1676]|uniref:sensor histidine kinase n=1 Tax=Paraflavitalea sp. CAU 1676 TaxID=3032598 RepID=UPI0023DB9210|nr:ATP-binding protein [Paraflavitalea sp. CAU 1676]MDF2191121.1 ATP-binding protein [Paraflavitalea sp. CAU 1676]